MLSLLVFKCLCAILEQVHDSLPDLDLDGFFCAHLTVDVNDGQRQPVLLIYDFFPVHPTLGVQAMPPRDRYAMRHNGTRFDHYFYDPFHLKCHDCQNRKNQKTCKTAGLFLVSDAHATGTASYSTRCKRGRARESVQSKSCGNGPVVSSRCHSSKRCDSRTRGPTLCAWVIP